MRSPPFYDMGLTVDRTREEAGLDGAGVICR